MFNYDIMFNASSLILYSNVYDYQCCSMTFGSGWIQKFQKVGFLSYHTIG
jgi:hypothetical protein